MAKGSKEQPPAGYSASDLANEMTAIANEDALAPFFEANMSTFERVVRATGMLDSQLRLCLILRFDHQPSKNDLEKVFEGYGPLASFSQRIAVCSASGIISGDTRHDLGHLKTVRNRFAHSVHAMNFDDAEVQKACMSLRAMADLPEYVPDHSMEKRFLESALHVYFVLFAKMALLHVEQRFIVAHMNELKAQQQAALDALSDEKMRFSFLQRRPSPEK